MNEKTKKNLVEILDNFRFKAYPREEYDKAKLYRYIGVEQYLWLYMNTIGGIAGKNAYSIHSIESHSIESHITKSKLFEIIHLTFLLINLIIHGEGNFSNYFILSNLLVNIYPILLQRYKRARLNKVANYRKQKTR